MKKFKLLSTEMKLESYIILLTLTFIFIACNSHDDKREIKENDNFIKKEVVRDIQIRKHIMEVRNFHRIHQKLNLAVFEEKLTPYMDANLQDFYTMDDLEFRITSEELIRLPDPDNPELIIDSIIKHRQDMDAIHMYRVLESWVYDIENYTYKGQLLAIAPVFNPVYEGVELGAASVYWLDIKEIENFLEPGDMESLSYYLFESFYTGIDAYGVE